MSTYRYPNFDMNHDSDEDPPHDATAETWRAGNEESSSDYIFIYDGKPHEGYVIAQVPWPDGEINKTIARARLLAKAPELYRALAKAYADDLDNGPFKDAVAALLKEAKAPEVKSLTHAEARARYVAAADANETEKP